MKLVNLKYLLLIILILGVNELVVAQVNINRMEYFIDIDPGIGNGTAVPVTIGPNITESFTIPTASLLPGFHTVYFRVQDINSEWSISESRSFFVSPSNLTTQANVVMVEYFIDTDPGFGSGTAIPVTAATDIIGTASIAAAALSPGFHSLYIRALDQDGVWSEIESRSFYVDALASGKISGIEYFFDTDPGIGNATATPINPAKAVLDSTLNLPTSALTAAAHTIGMRLLNENGVYGITTFANLTLCDGAVAKIAADTVCVGTGTTLQDLSTNVLAGDVFSWDFDGDGLEDANTAGIQTFVYPTPGTYKAALSIDRTGCVGTDTFLVNVVDVPMANAGPDQSLCTNATALAASVLGVNETGSWSIVNGTGTIADSTNQASAISNITSASIELTWTVTNTLGGCTASDNVILTPNLPISAAKASPLVDIGQSASTDVQALALVNAGDVLTTSILTDPLYGVATVNGSGAIDYTPDLDAPSLDSLYYRLTNQCSNLSENYVVYTIGNAPPVVDNQNVVPTVTNTAASIDLTAIISDPNNNVDLTNITIVTPPSSGATASVDVNGVLTIDYRGLTFNGTDQLEIQVCDLSGSCVVQAITIPNISVGGTNPPIRVFNGVSPDGDGFNDFLEIENIEFYPNNTVIILNRWGDEVERFQGYDNQSNVFRNSNLPSGTYYYHIITGIENVKPVTGHFLLKIDN